MVCGSHTSICIKITYMWFKYRRLGLTSSFNSVGLGWVPLFAFLTNSQVIQMLSVQRAHCENQWIGKWVKNSEFIPGGWGKFACLGLNVQGCDSYRFCNFFFIACFLPLHKFLLLAQLLPILLISEAKWAPSYSHINYYNNLTPKTREGGYLIISLSFHIQNLLASEYLTNPKISYYCSREKIIKIPN